MPRLDIACLLACLVMLVGSAAAEEAPPRSLDSRLKIELFAEEPQIVTPTGLDIDPQGRVWAIESNTHFPPEGYQGHPSDRLLVMSDTDRDGRADKIVVFKDGLRHAMSVALRPVWEGGSQSRKVSESQGKNAVPPRGHSGSETLRLWNSATSSVYVATRREIILLSDTDGDDRADREERIVHLETKGDYPHNGLAGFAFDALGWMYFGFGENLGADYKIIGSDGTTLSGGGEGGNIYRSRLDGTELSQVATGFWNPHASCVDAFGRVFTVDNDPDSRPPCRLLHVIPGGDYGYRFRNGRKGLHPFTSWNGEIPGTLPMVAGTGEAPSGILAYESDGLPEEFLGNLLVTSWGDHRIDRFRLKAKGASFESLTEPLIVGGENFRPVGIACAPDGSLYCTDWVLRDYNVHGRGRVWRISAKQSRSAKSSHALPTFAGLSGDELGRALESPRKDVRRLAARRLTTSKEGRERLLKILATESKPARQQIEALWALSLVPVEVQSFGFVVSSFEDVKILTKSSAVEEAATSLLGSPQFPFDRATQSVWRGDKTSVCFTQLTGDHSGDQQQSLSIVRHIRADELEEVVDLFVAMQDPFEVSTVVTVLAERDIPEEEFAARVKTPPDEYFAPVPIPIGAPINHLAYLLAGRKTHPRGVEIIKAGLDDKSSMVRRATIQWIAEEKLTEFRPQVEGLLNDPHTNSDLFLATLAALEMLEGVPPAEFDKTPPGKYVLPLLKDENRSPAVRALALRMVDPQDPALDVPLLGRLLASSEPALRLEAVRTAQQSSLKEVSEPLRKIAADEMADTNLRADAVVGLARPDQSGKLPTESRDLLLLLLTSEQEIGLAHEALRSLRGSVPFDAALKQQLAKIAGGKSAFAGEVRDALDASGGLRPRLAGEGLRKKLGEKVNEGDDRQAGRRGFYHANGAGCFKCHTIDGRGGKIGPDLSTIGRSLSREKLLDSILEPSKEIAPQFVAWAIETADGKVHTGMIVHENEGTTVLGDTEGRLTTLKTIDIVDRVPQKISVMPEKLAERMTLQEFRDLLAFLESLR